MEIPVSKIEPEFQNLKAGQNCSTIGSMGSKGPGAMLCQDSKGQAITKAQWESARGFSSGAMPSSHIILLNIPSGY